MSLHRSLKTKSGALNQHRNVLSRAERVAHLVEADQLDMSKDSPLGMVKYGSRTVTTKKRSSGTEP